MIVKIDSIVRAEVPVSEPPKIEITMKEMQTMNSQIGTILKRKLSWFESPEAGGCQTCKNTASTLDSQTPDWAEKNIEWIVNKMMEGAAKRTSVINIPGISQFSRMVARQIAMSAIEEARQIISDNNPVAKP